MVGGGGDGLAAARVPTRHGVARVHARGRRHVPVPVRDRGHRHARGRGRASRDDRAHHHAHLDAGGRRAHGRRDRRGGDADLRGCRTTHGRRRPRSSRLPAGDPAGRGPAGRRPGPTDRCGAGHRGHRSARPAAAGRRRVDDRRQLADGRRPPRALGCRGRSRCGGGAGVARRRPRQHAVRGEQRRGARRRPPVDHDHHLRPRRRCRATRDAPRAHGTVDVLVSPPFGMSVPPVDATITYELRVRTIRLD